MNKTRLRYAAQDKILAAILEAARAEHPRDNAVANEMTSIGAKLAAKWGVNFPGIPDTRRDAAS